MVLDCASVYHLYYILFYSKRQATFKGFSSQETGYYWFHKFNDEISGRKVRYQTIVRKIQLYWKNGILGCCLGYFHNGYHQVILWFENFPEICNKYRYGHFICHTLLWKRSLPSLAIVVWHFLFYFLNLMLSYEQSVVKRLSYKRRDGEKSILLN